MNYTTVPDDTSTTTGAPAHRWWVEIADELRQRRLDRAARMGLRDELATYSTPNDVNDLLGALRDHDDSTADEIRSILTGNLVRRQQWGQLTG